MDSPLIESFFKLSNYFFSFSDVNDAPPQLNGTVGGATSIPQSNESPSLFQCSEPPDCPPDERLIPNQWWEL
ncbi:hypothetical protein, partial [Acidianus infernus]|uniref:hypothetical protein n=1 Tax=Acidianus infernus TaxID=12915 RepID=UPI00359430DA